jgi:anthranilate/para-aminobenzoate synthase component II
VQFHPESIMSEYGHEIIDNFLKLWVNTFYF